MSSKKIESWFEIFKTVVALVIALGLGFIVIVLVSEEPGKAITAFLTGPLSTLRRFGNVIEQMTPLIFTGLAIAVMFQANQFNMIPEGAFMFAGCMGTAAATSGWNLPPLLLCIVSLAIAGIAGMSAAFIPGILKVKWRANEVVSSIMLNTVLMQLSIFLVKKVIVDISAGQIASYPIPEGVGLKQFVHGTRIHTGIFIALAFVIVMYVFLYKSKWGYEIRVVGYNAEFAKYSGISVMAVMLLSNLIGGFVAGVGGAVEVFGMYSRYTWVNLTNHGWDGMLVGILAKSNPLYVPLAAFLLAYMRCGSDVMNATTDVSSELIQVIQSLIIMLIAAQMLMSGMKHKLIVKNAKRAESEKEAAK